MSASSLTYKAALWNSVMSYFHIVVQLGTDMIQLMLVKVVHIVIITFFKNFGTHLFALFPFLQFEPIRFPPGYLFPSYFYRPV